MVEDETRRHLVGILLPRAGALVAALARAGIEPAPALARLRALPLHATQEDAGDLAVFWADFRTMRVLVMAPDTVGVVEDALAEAFGLVLALQ